MYFQGGALLANSTVIKCRVLSVEKCDFTISKAKYMRFNGPKFGNQKDLKDL